MIEIRVTHVVETRKPEATYDRLAQERFEKLEKDVKKLETSISVILKLIETKKV